MRLFRRRRPEPAGILAIGEHSGDAADYDVFAVGESRFPETFSALWSSASEDERQHQSMRRWAVLQPVRDPAFGVAEVRVELGGMTAGYLRPPHLGLVAGLIDRDNAVAARVPALVVKGPAGPTVTLRIVAGT